jgi:hypothetical protein
MIRQNIFKGLAVGLLIAAAVLTAVPVLAGDGLPERKTPVADDDGRDDSGPLGGRIELAAWPPGAVSVVQWQDVNGDWHDVDGWHGNLDKAGRIRWWVAAKDFGRGPFRWVVESAISAPFHLPAGARQTVEINLSTQP